MTLWCDKFGAVIFKALYFIGKFLGLIALQYDKTKKLFRTTIASTVTSSAICVFVIIISPLLVKLNLELFFVSGVNIDDNMYLITCGQNVFDIATSVVVFLCQLWKRNQITHCGNVLQNVLNTLTIEMGCGNIVSREMIILFGMKLCITFYEVLINLPFFIAHGNDINAERFVAFFLNLYIAEIAAVFSDIAFAVLLLLARYFYLLDGLLESLKMQIQAEGVTRKQIRQYRRKLLRVIELYLQMKRIVPEFSECIEISIFVKILHSFANMLTNLYALLDFAIDESLEPKDLVYNVMLFLNICLMIQAAERVQKSSADLKNTLLDLDASGGGGSNGSQWRSDVLVFKIWPDVTEVDVLGMFPLNNTFLLFLLAYASNFVVIILQFEMTRVLYIKRGGV